MLLVAPKFKKKKAKQKVWFTTWSDTDATTNECLLSNDVLLKVPDDKINNNKINTKNMISLDKQKLEKILQVQVHEKVFAISQENKTSSELDNIIVNVKQGSLWENTDEKENPMKKSV